MKAYLTPRERQVYQTLKDAGGIVSREELRVMVFGDDYDASMVKTYIYHLRRKGIPIENVRGTGYLLGPLQRCPLCGSPRLGDE